MEVMHTKLPQSDVMTTMSFFKNFIASGYTTMNGEKFFSLDQPNKNKRQVDRPTRCRSKFCWHDGRNKEAQYTEHLRCNRNYHSLGGSGHVKVIFRQSN